MIVRVETLIMRCQGDVASMKSRTERIRGLGSCRCQWLCPRPRLSAPRHEYVETTTTAQVDHHFTLTVRLSQLRLSQLELFLSMPAEQPDSSTLTFSKLATTNGLLQLSPRLALSGMALSPSLV